jgi:hypothetical protein
MPIESGTYCQYCADEKGQLHPYEESVERMMQYMMRQKPGVSRDEAMKQTLAYMSQMPAWRDNPKLKAAMGK